MAFVILLIVFVIVIAAAAYARNADGGYTMGKNLFKSSGSCLDEKEDDASGYGYWDKNKFK